MDRIWYKSDDPGVLFSREYPETCLPLILSKNARLVPGSIATEFLARGHLPPTVGSRAAPRQRPQTDGRGGGD